jgi:hypothetical protein
VLQSFLIVPSNFQYQPFLFSKKRIKASVHLNNFYT